MNSLKTIAPRSESKKLLSLPTRQAEQLFQSYAKQQQLDILSATRNPRSREKLYYLVPDCTELIQESPTEDVLQVLDTMLGTGLASALLPCLSNDQFEELLDIAVWRDGKLDEESLDLWLFELSECERDDLGRFLRELDIRLLAALLHGRVTLQDLTTAGCFSKLDTSIPPHPQLIIPTNGLGRFVMLSGKPMTRFLERSSGNSSQLIQKAMLRLNSPPLSMLCRLTEHSASQRVTKQPVLTSLKPTS